jgi:hypothetical protein
LQLEEDSINVTKAKEIIILTNQMTNMADRNLRTRYSGMKIRKEVYSLCATIPRVDRWTDVVVAALEFGDLSGIVQLHDVSWVYAALQDVLLSKENVQKDWDAATEEHVLQLLDPLNDAIEFPTPSEKVLQVILKALSTEGPCSDQALRLLFKAKSWFIDTDFQSTMQEHNVWSRMGAVMKTSLQTQVYQKEYIRLGQKLSSLIQWTPYIHSNPSHWITIYIGMSESEQWLIHSPYHSVLECIWGVKYNGTYELTTEAEKALAWTLITLGIVWEGFDSSGQQSLQDFYQLIKCATSTAFKSHYYDDILGHIPISPNFRAAFYTPLGDSLIQAARNAEDMVPGGPTQSDNQPDLDGSLQEKTQVSQVLQQAARILDEMGQALKLESEGEQVDHGEEGAKTYWDNLRTHFKVQVNELEESVKEAPETTEISG